LEAPGQHDMRGKTAADAGLSGEDPEVPNKCCPNILSASLLGLTALLGCPCLPCGIRQLDVSQKAAVLYWGEYIGTLHKPGLYWLNPCGLQLWRISTKQQTLQLKDMKVLDSRGNPVVVSGIVAFAGTSAKKATVDVDNPFPTGVGTGFSSSYGSSTNTYLGMQSAAVLKRVASRFPYEAPAGEASLQSEGQQISQMLKSELQEKVDVTGAQIFSFDLVDLSYAPEIAQVMLVRQQAEALVDARRVIVSAAVDMTREAVSSLKNSGEPMDDSTCREVTKNLLTVICSGATATPTVALK